MHNTDKVEDGLMVLFFGLVFSVAPLPEIFLPPLVSLLQTVCEQFFDKTDFDVDT